MIAHALVAGDTVIVCESPTEPVELGDVGEVIFARDPKTIYVRVNGFVFPMFRASVRLHTKKERT